MHQIEITRERYIEGEGVKTEPFPLNIYTQPNEITLAQAVVFQEAFLGCPQWFIDLHQSTPEEVDKILGEWKRENFVDYYTTIAQLLVHLIEPKEGQEFTLVDMLKAKQEAKTKDSLGGNIYSLWQIVLAGFFNWQPTFIKEFTHKGHTYALPAITNLGEEQQRLGTNLRTIEAVEALHAEHVYNSLDENGNYHFKNRKYHISLVVIAATCRKIVNGVPEEIPVQNVNTWDAFIARRCKELADIPFDIAENVYFFLANSKSRWKMIPIHAMLLFPRLRMRK